MIWMVGIIALVYVWVWYSMNVLHNPLVLMAVYYPVLCLGGGLVLRKFMGNIIPSNFYMPENHRECAVLTLKYSVLSTLVIWLGLLAIKSGMVDSEIINDGLEACGMYRESYWITGIGVVLVNPIFEEMLWRWGLVTFLDSRFGDKNWVGLHLSSLIFAGYHPIVAFNLFSPPWLLVIFILAYLAGLMFVRLYRKSRGLHFVMIFHMGVNLNLMLLGYLFAPPSGG